MGARAAACGSARGNRYVARACSRDGDGAVLVRPRAEGGASVRLQYGARSQTPTWARERQPTAQCRLDLDDEIRERSSRCIARRASTPLRMHHRALACAASACGPSQAWQAAPPEGRTGTSRSSANYQPTISDRGPATSSPPAARQPATSRLPATASCSPATSATSRLPATSVTASRSPGYQPTPASSETNGCRSLFVATSSPACAKYASPPVPVITKSTPL